MCVFLYLSLFSLFIDMFEKDFSATPLNFVYVNVRGEELDQYSAILTRFYSVRRTTKKDEKKSNKMLEEGKSLNKKKIWWQYFGKRDKRSNDKRDRILRFWYIECVYAFEWSTLSARCDNTSLHGIFFASLQIIPNRKPVVDGYVTVSWYYSHQYFRKIQVLFELPLHKQRIWMFSFVRHCILFSEWVRFFQLRFPAVKYMHFDDFESWAATALMKPRIDKFADWFPI